jgi:hypothetical protein
MNIAVFADLHGRILLAFKIVARYQRETGQRIDLILQCGDVGVFPHLAGLDKGTRHHAAEDETELGFAKYFVAPQPEAEAVLAEVDCNVVCVRGNHEDHAYLDGLEQASRHACFPVDCYRRIRVLRTGIPYRASHNGQAINIVGIGRVGLPANMDRFRQPQHIQPHEIRRIENLDDLGIDVLLTHDGRLGFAKPGRGMEEIGLVLDLHRPRYHFHGHTGKPVERRVDTNGVTTVCKPSDFVWEGVGRNLRMAPGCLAVLTWNGADNHHLEVINARWLREYTPRTWRHL